MATVQQVFDTAIHMMDEQNESSGGTVTQDTEEYKLRTINLLNTLILLLYPYSDTQEAAAAGKRPTPPLLTVDNYKNPDFAQKVPLDETLSIGILPYGLAAHLLIGENTELASWFMSRWNQGVSEIRSRSLAEFVPIHNPYGYF